MMAVQMAPTFALCDELMSIEYAVVVEKSSHDSNQELCDKYLPISKYSTVARFGTVPYLLTVPKPLVLLGYLA